MESTGLRGPHRDARVRRAARARSSASAAIGLILTGMVLGCAWRWIFYANLPVGVLILLASWRYLRDDRLARRPRKFDVTAALTSTGGLGLLTYALVQTGTHPWHSARTIGLLAAAAALLAYFAVHELTFAADPLLPFSLLRNRAVTGANTVSALSGAGLVSVFYFATLYLQQVLHYSALKTGLAYLPLTGLFMVVAGLGPVLIPPNRHPICHRRRVADLGGQPAAADPDHPGRNVAGQRHPAHHDLRGRPGGLLYPDDRRRRVPSPARAHRRGLGAGKCHPDRWRSGRPWRHLDVVTTRISRQAAGHPAGEALSSGFRLAFVITAVLLAAAAVFALAIFRDEGRGEKINLAEVTRAGIES